MLLLGWSLGGRGGCEALELMLFGVSLSRGRSGGISRDWKGIEGMRSGSRFPWSLIRPAKAAAENEDCSPPIWGHFRQLCCERYRKVSVMDWYEGGGIPEVKISE